LGAEENICTYEGQTTGEWRRLHNEELNTLYSSPNIIEVIKLRRIRWAWQVAGMGRGAVRTWFWWGNLRGRDHLEVPVVDGSIIHKNGTSINGMGVWTRQIWLRTGTGARAFMKAVMNHLFSKMRGISLAENRLASGGKLCPWS